MENDLISRSALIEQLERLAVHEDAFRQSCILGIVHTIAQAPAIDAVPVVRCKDCERIKQGRFDIFKFAYCDLWKTDMQMDNFCCFGNRRADDGK